MKQNIDFQLGLLHFVHLLVTVDGHIDRREEEAIDKIKSEENIPAGVLQFFTRNILQRGEREIYQEGLERLNRCSEEERLCAFVHLYRLAKADQKMDVKEVRLLLYSIKQTSIEFDDVVLTAHLAQAYGEIQHGVS
jgi:uncharacterized tellurite resistance protein B-like protein